MSSDLEKIDKLLKKAPEGRASYYQLQCFVLGKEPTMQSQMWQCLTELQSRRETIDNITFEIDNLKDQMELNVIEQERCVCEDKRERKIKLRILKRNRESTQNNINKLEKKLNYVIQEARFFVKAFEVLEEKEPLKDFDDLEAQKELWEAKISEEINLRILLNQGLNTDLIKTALALHPDSNVRSEVLKMIENFKSPPKLERK